MFIPIREKAGVPRWCNFFLQLPGIGDFDSLSPNSKLVTISCHEPVTALVTFVMCSVAQLALLSISKHLLRQHAGKGFAGCNKGPEGPAAFLLCAHAGVATPCIHVNVAGRPLLQFVRNALHASNLFTA